MKEILTLIDNNLGNSPWFPYLLLGTGLFFTLYLGFPQIRFFKKSFQLLFGNGRIRGEGDTSPFQALSTALSGTIGTGNIAGVAIAIHFGGPGALFWMVMSAVVGMCTKFVEVSFSHKYREKTPDGTFSGGPMYFMSKKMGLKWLAIIFAVATVICSFGSSFPQINSICDALYSTFSLERWITGVVLTVLLALVILGGIRRIAMVAERVVPGMAVFYVIGALIILVHNYEQIPFAVGSIFSNLLSFSSVSGGFLGAGIAMVFSQGVSRGLFSNEAGQGSSAIAHASSNTKDPIEEGVVALLEPFIDTIVICSITGLVIITTGAWNDKVENRFQKSDLLFLDGVYSQQVDQDVGLMRDHLSGDNKEALLTGEVVVAGGEILGEVTLLCARSVAEGVRVTMKGEPYDGKILVREGAPKDLKGIQFTGRSLVKGAPLTIEAFKKSWMGNYGEYFVTIGILFFAFTTVVSWSYYGDRAATFLFGYKSVLPYRVIYIIGFMLASQMDTSLTWIIVAITVPMMTIPNLVGILSLRATMKKMISGWPKS